MTRQRHASLGTSAVNIAAVTLFGCLGTLCRVFVTLVALTFPLSAQAARATSCSEQAKLLVQQTISDQDIKSRSNHGYDMENYIFDHGNCASSRIVIEQLMKLLADPVEALRIEAAMSLGAIGPPARRAVPALLVAIKQSDSSLDADNETVLPIDTSGNEARYAIFKITGQVIPPYTRAKHTSVPKKN